MKIVYVGDNRNRMNFGCRATSTALSQLISREHEIVGRVHGNFRNVDTKKVFFIKHLPGRVYQCFGRRKHWPIFKEVFVDTIHIARRLKVAFSSNDFLSFDFDESVKNLIKCIPANDDLAECDLRQYDFDALVVNGEGSFVFSEIPWREAMLEATLMYWAKKMGKKVYFLNAMFSSTPGCEPNMKTVNLMKPVLEEIDYIVVREKQSLEFASQYFSNANIELHPDALFTWGKYINDNMCIQNGRCFIGPSGASDASFDDFDFTQPYICVSGSSSSDVTKDLKLSIEAYVKLVNALKERLGINVYIVIPCEIDNFLLQVAEKTDTPVITVDSPILAAGKILANAAAYVTGRYHPSILAALGGTPCVFMGSNSHKNFSLQQTLEYENPHEYNAVPSDQEIELIVSEVHSLIDGGVDVRKRIKDRCQSLGKWAESMVSVLEN